MSMNETLKIACWATGGKYGSGVYEVHGHSGLFRGLIPVSLFKEKGLVKRIDHTKRAEQFLNTDEGKKFFLENRSFS